jgi:hypothetical protein
MRQALLLCLLVVLLAVFETGMANVPRTMSYQGVLKDAVGNVVSDGDYEVTFKLYMVHTGGMVIWTETQTLSVADGIFNAILGSVTPLTVPFDRAYWLGVSVEGEPELEPRVELTASPYALRAATADLVDDGDWVLWGDDVYRLDGVVGIGMVPSDTTNALIVLGENQRVAHFIEIDNGQDGEHRHGAVRASRAHGGQYSDPGTDHSYHGSNWALLGENEYGDPFSWGVSGITRFHNSETAAVHAFEESTALWSALAYRDSDLHDWGVYTPGDAYVGGTLRLPDGATNGHVLTSDGDGNASWQESVGSPDDDWVILGDDIYHEAGRVLIGESPARSNDEWPVSKLDQRQGSGRDGWRLGVNSTDGVAVRAYESETADDPDDDLGAIIGVRASNLSNPGSGYSPGDINFGVAGYNAHGDSYTFGVAGLANLDQVRTGAVYGCGVWQENDVWASLAYQDEVSQPWGVYTPANVYIGGGLRIPNAAELGHVLTSNGEGWGSWQPPAGLTLPWSGVYSGDEYAAFSVYKSGGSMPALRAQVIGDGGSAASLDISATGNDSPVVDAGTVGDGPAYYGETSGSGTVAHFVKTTGDTEPALEVSSEGPSAAVFDSYGANGATVYATGWCGGAEIVEAGRFRAYGEYGDYASIVRGLDAFADTGHRCYGIRARAATGDTCYGVYADAIGGGLCYGVYADARQGGYCYGVYATSDSAAGISYAGYFDGPLHAESVTASVKAFTIDHPLDPGGKYLSHSSVESPDMMNVYNGNVILSASGDAWVELPAWFEALNRDYRYQLTAIGAAGPNLHIAEKVSNNRFRIAGGEPGMEVSWQVTGIRHDALAETARVKVEEDKRPENVGKYLNPEAFGLPRTSGIHYVGQSDPPRREERIR